MQRAWRVGGALLYGTGKGVGDGVLKPFGESGRYDVAVENGGPILRVQVKSTIFAGEEMSTA